MKIAIITVAGVSSRFNKGITDENKELKAVYYEDNPKNTLLYHLLLKCSNADRVVVVGGYKYETLKEYVFSLEEEIKRKIDLVRNDHFDDLGSGYSLYLGLKQAFKYEISEVLFVEGDLDIDGESFHRVAKASGNILTYNNEPIYANKAVVLYKDESECYKYAFNSNHGLLTITQPFSCILNSGQLWKFTDIGLLRKANDIFYSKASEDTNLRIIQNYLDMGVKVSLVPLKRWTNCNTRSDYKKILSYWENEQ